MKRAALSVLGIAALAAGLLAGCATTPGGDLPDVDGETLTPDTGTTVPTDGDIEAAWLDGGRLIGIVTYGSSTCVPVVDTATLNGDVIDVTFVEPDPNTPCTADYAPRVSIAGTPEGVDPTQDIEIRVSGDGQSDDTDLDGVPGLVAGGSTDYLPSAGWTGEDGQFIMLTWGSSTCVPMVESVEASGPTEVTVVIASPATDQVCTMDMVPRAAVLAVTGIDDDSANVEMVLTGGEFADVRVPIVGSD